MKQLNDGEKVVDSGVYFRVGDGALIDVAIDPWIPSLSNYVLSGSIDSRLYGLKVGDLINRVDI